MSKDLSWRDAKDIPLDSFIYYDEDDPEVFPSQAYAIVSNRIIDLYIEHGLAKPNPYFPTKTIFETLVHVQNHCLKFNFSEQIEYDFYNERD